METYHADSRKKRKALKQVVKENVKSSKRFIKFCYVLTFLMRIAAVILGVLNIIYVIIHENPLALIFLIIFFLFPYLFSLLPATVYVVACGGELRFRRNEAIIPAKGGFIYTYRDNRIGFENSTFVLHIMYDRIHRREYNEKTCRLTLYGNIAVDTYVSGELEASEEYEGIDLLNVFDVDVKNLIEKNCQFKASGNLEGTSEG